MQLANNIIIQVTNDCPFACKQCYAQKGKLVLPVIQAERVIDQTFKGRKGGIVQITGGEPLLYPDLEELIRFCFRRDIYTCVATSGYGATAKKLQTLKNEGLNCLCVSLNGSDKQVHQHTREGFDFAISALQNAKTVCIESVINWVACGSNVGDLPNIIALAKSLNVNAICILKKLISYDKTNQDFPTQSQLDYLKAEVEKNKDFLLVEECYKELNGLTQCGAGKEFFYLNANGEIHPCSAYIHGNKPVCLKDN